MYFFKISLSDEKTYLEDQRDEFITIDTPLFPLGEKTSIGVNTSGL